MTRLRSVLLMLCLTTVATAVVPAQAARTSPEPSPVTGEVRVNSLTVAVTAHDTGALDRALGYALTARAAAEAHWYTTVAARNARVAHASARVSDAPVAAPVTAEPEVSPASGDDDGCGGWRSLIEASFGSSGRACRVMMCESTGDEKAWNRSGASGLFQIKMPLHSDLFAAHGWPDSAVFDGPKNIVVASEMVASGGWGAWVCTG